MISMIIIYILYINFLKRVIDSDLINYFIFYKKLL